MQSIRIALSPAINVEDRKAALGLVAAENAATEQFTA
jgi:hypothetical protein